jgi:hypothetical protein
MRRPAVRIGVTIGWNVERMTEPFFGGQSCSLSGTASEPLSIGAGVDVVCQISRNTRPGSDAIGKQRASSSSAMTDASEASCPVTMRLGFLCCISCRNSLPKRATCRR